MSVSGEIIGPATLALSQSIGAFQFFLPHLSEVRKVTPDSDPSKAADVRLGEVAACTLAVGVGLVIANLTGSSVPLFATLVMSAVLVTVYEASLRADHPLQSKGLSNA